MDFRKRFFQPHPADGKIGVQMGLLEKIMRSSWDHPRAMVYQGLAFAYTLTEDDEHDGTPGY